MKEPYHFNGYGSIQSIGDLPSMSSQTNGIQGFPLEAKVNLGSIDTGLRVASKKSLDAPKASVDAALQGAGPYFDVKTLKNVAQFSCVSAPNSLARLKIGAIKTL